MFDWFEAIYDLFFFTILYLACFEAVAVLFNLGFGTLMPSWLSGVFSLSWERLPVVFVFALFMAYVTKSKLRDMGGGSGFYGN